MSTAAMTGRSVETNSDLTEALEERLNHPATSPDFDLNKGANEVLADVGMTSDDCGGELAAGLPTATAAGRPRLPLPFRGAPAVAAHRPIGYLRNR